MYSCLLGDNKENDDPDEVDQQRFNELVMKAKKLIGEGNIEDALKLNKKALSICYSEKLAKKIKKMEVILFCFIIYKMEVILFCYIPLPKQTQMAEHVFCFEEKRF
jgi:hypothetical protein